MPLARRSHGKSHPRQIATRMGSIDWLFWDAASQWRRDNAMRLSAAVSFYAVLSLAPLLAIVIRVMGIAHARQFGQEEILKQATALMGAQAADAIKPILDNKAAQEIGLLPTAVSTVVLLFSATSVFNELHDSMNSIWGVENRARKGSRAEHAILTFIRSRLLSLAIVFFLGLLLVVFLFITGIHTTLQGNPTGLGRWTDYFVGAAISLGVEFALFALMFKFLPSAHPKLRNVLPGALIAALLFGVGRFGLAIYFKHSSISSAYGAAGSLVAVFTWIYYSSFSLFYGVEFTKAWTRRFEPGHAPGHEMGVSDGKTRA